MSATFKDYQTATTSILDSDQSNRRLLYIFTALSGLVAIQIMHLALDDLKINGALAGGLVLGFIYSFVLPLRLRAATTYVVSGLSVIIALRYYQLIRVDETMLGTYLAILAGILMVLLAFKAFSPADHRFILMFSVVFLLFSSVASYDLKFMLLLPLFLVFAGCSLYLANQVDVSVRVSGTAGQRFQLKLGFGQGFASVLARGVAGIILLASVAYIVVPHTGETRNSLFLNSSPKVDRAEERRGREDDLRERGGNTSDTVEVGLSTSFDLTDTRRLTSDPRPVLKMRSHKVGYLRALVFDVYTGTGWERSEDLEDSLEALLIVHNPYNSGLEDDNSFEVPLFDFPGESYAETLQEKHGIELVADNNFSSSEGDLDYDIVRQEVVLIEEQLPFYFSIYQPFKLINVSLDRSGELLDKPVVDGASILRPPRLDDYHPAGFSYTVYSLEPRIDAAKLERVVGKPDEEILRQYTQLPLSGTPRPAELGGLNIATENYRQISQRMKTFSARFNAAGEGQAGAINTWETVRAIVDYLTNEEEFTYTRQFNPLDGQQEITEAFCLGTQEGYCQYFATSMAVLCRLNNIPARVVKGYSPGTFSIVDNAYIYKASNSHVWCEVYFNGYGWITFDPSPSGEDPTDTAGALGWLNNTLNFLQELFVLDPASTRETIMQALKSAWGWVLEHSRTAMLIAAGVLVLIGLYFLATRVRLRRRKRFVPQNDVIATYLKLRGVLSRLGHPAQPSSTARTLLSEAALRFPAIAGELNGFIPVYEAAAFSGAGVGQVETERARDLLQQVEGFATEVLRRKKQR
jgi:transglutaminase-like putative cysteine protease